MDFTSKDSGEINDKFSDNNDEYFDEVESSNDDFAEKIKVLHIRNVLKDMSINLNVRKVYTIKDFDIISFLGTGAHSKVVLAKEIDTGKVVAIKITDKSLLERENKLYQIYIENELLYKLTDPSIIDTYGAFEQDGKFFLVLEYCRNGDLYNFIVNNSYLLISASF